MTALENVFISWSNDNSSVTYWLMGLFHEGLDDESIASSLRDKWESIVSPFSYNIEKDIIEAAFHDVDWMVVTCRLRELYNNKKLVVN